MFWRVRCHFCGTRQPHSKSVTEFQCNTCEAINFLDGKGNIVDTPSNVAASSSDPQQQKSLLSVTQSQPSTNQNQNQPSFCSTCTQNQHLYNAILAEYLPEESHPSYAAKERALPEYKKELEKRYPLVCKRCAPMVQGRINKADYFGITQNAARLGAATRARGGRAAYRARDDAWKKFMRNMLRLIGFVLYLGLLAQVGFHVYGILSVFISPSTLPEDFGHVEGSEDYFAPTAAQCARQATRFTFDTPCYNVFSALIPGTLVLAATFLWFNPGIKAWYHHTRRIEAVHGQNNYFYMQVIILAIRSMAWYTVSDTKYIAKLDREHVIAVHGFAILFMLMTQAIANRSITLQNWTMKGKVMPKPEEQDILSETAAEPEPHFTSKPSSNDPWKYLRKEEQPSWDSLLAPKAKQPVLRPNVGLYQPPPSPEDSEFGDEDAMETDYRPVMRSSQRLNMQQRPRLEPTHTYMNHSNAPPLSFGDVRNGLSGVEYQMHAEDERRQQEEQQKLQYLPERKSPFYGSLPPAPMSMERRLRNPVLRPTEPAKVPLSQQKDFMAQMRRGVKPVQFPEKGSNFELKKSSWVLPSDKKELGFEDRFMNTFSLQDGSPAGQKKGLFGLW
ncbi:Integral inner nuclear membrane protein ima1 [Pseudocercospora fuligena]|uniref:Integral inner nuclear membrane protein ima1 n=1 Tax=Pseudocercospora fuligena TaxID=685502 RepID=A0A8H6VJF9_9PEZI|nr:Integral inner nuclear membrane protein ima1 [Pseudocercospora fuligena]